MWVSKHFASFSTYWTRYQECDQALFDVRNTFISPSHWCPDQQRITPHLPLPPECSTTRLTYEFSVSSSFFPDLSYFQFPGGHTPPPSSSCQHHTSGRTVLSHIASLSRSTHSNTTRRLRPLRWVRHPLSGMPRGRHDKCIELHSTIVNQRANA